MGDRRHLDGRRRRNPIQHRQDQIQFACNDLMQTKKLWPLQFHKKCNQQTRHTVRNRLPDRYLIEAPTQIRLMLLKKEMKLLEQLNRTNRNWLTT